MTSSVAVPAAAGRARPAELVASAPRTMLARRFEPKFVVTRSTRTALARDLAVLMQPDGHAGGEDGYLVRSLYFDTVNYLHYHEKLEGVGVRHKLRARVYGADDPGAVRFVRLEIKKRYYELVAKTVADIPIEEWPDVERALTRRGSPPPHLLEQGHPAAEFFRLQRQLCMEPKVVVQYRRQAWERREVGRCRANFDGELVASRNLDLLAPLRNPRPLLGADRSVFEVKVDEALPWWMHGLVAKYDLQNQAVSKYVHAVRSEALLTSTHREDGW